MQSVNQETRETANLVLWNGHSAVCIEKIDSPESITIQHTQIGHTEPLHSSGLGKAILAYLPETEVKDVLKGIDLKRTTHNTLTTATALRADLQSTRERGFAIDDEEGIIGIRCVACPILGHLGNVVGAISLAGPSIRMSKKRVLELGPDLRNIAAHISLKLGYNPRRSAHAHTY